MKRVMSSITLAMALMIIGIINISAQEDSSSVYVLVHGAFQDEAGWDSIVTTLEDAGEIVITVQSPGRGDDPTPAHEQSLIGYRDNVIDVISAQSQPVILVGHSFGGIVISEVAEAIPEQIETLVYLAAYLPQSGDSLLSLSEYEHNSVLGEPGNLIVSDDSTVASINTDIFASAFCPDCDEEQAEFVSESQVDEPLIPLATPVNLTDDNFGSVEKVYILTAEDIVVSPQLQVFMLSRTPVDHVFALNTGHAAYITDPVGIAAILMQFSE
ncbi:MAG: alpha/beta fold hydrolase [Chloroflexota bacterium]